MNSKVGQSILLSTLVTLFILVGCSHPQSTEEVVFHSGTFKLVGDLTLPEGRSPYPVILFVHGDGPNDRISGGTYVPIMERVLRAGFATFAWDKPGTGESTGFFDRSRLLDERSQIVLDAIEVVKDHPDIDGEKIGLWGISQAGYVMPVVLSKSDDVAFMIAVSCAGEPGVEQGAYLVSSQASCIGMPDDDVEQLEVLLSAVESAPTYVEYVGYKNQLDAFPLLGALNEFGLSVRTLPEDEWHVPKLEGEYFWDPIEVIEKTTIPVLAFFGAKDTNVDPVQGAEAYRQALERAGNLNYRVELIPDTDHFIVLSETGCILENRRRSASERLNYAPEYLDILEAWLQDLYP